MIASKVSSPTRVSPQYRPLRALALAALLTAPVPAVAQGGIPATYRAAADSLIRGATRDSAAYDRLGPAGRWLRPPALGLAQPRGRHRLDPVGDEEGRPGERPRRAGQGEELGAGRGVRGAGPPPPRHAEHAGPRRQRGDARRQGITAPVLVVSSFEELERRRAEAKGKIVLFDMPFTNYGDTRRYRTDGPSAAARAGAVACLLRSVASLLDPEPAHRPDRLRQHRAPDPRRGAQRGGRDDAAPDAGPGRGRGAHAQDGRPHAAARRLTQRRGGAAGPGAARRSRRPRRAHRLLGRGAGRDGRRAAARSPRGRRSA